MAYLYIENDLVRDYGEGRASVQDFLNVCASYRGPSPHFLFSGQGRASVRGVLFVRLLQRLSEEKLCPLLEAIIAAHPQVLTLQSWEDSLLHLALRWSNSSVAIRLLAVPQNTRILDPSGRMPLHAACAYDGIDPDVVHHLIDLDPDVLTLPESASTKRIPLHFALENDPSSAHVQRMIHQRPGTLHIRNDHGQTPVAYAIARTLLMAGTRPGGAEALRLLVVRYPQTLSLPRTELRTRTPSTDACDYHSSRHPHEQLSRAVLEAHPPSLVIPEMHNPIRKLPFEMATNRWRYNDSPFVRFVQDETVHMALAVVEYVLGVSTDDSAMVRVGDADAGTAAENVAWFQGHITDTVRAHVPSTQLAEASSGFTVAQALRSQDDSILLAVVRALFCHDRAFELLRGESRLLRTVAFCDTVMDLYRLNRQGRYYRPLVPSTSSPAAHDVKDDDDMVAAALHQIDLLESLRDSPSLDSTYLQFREVSHHSLLVHGRRTRCRKGYALASGTASTAASNPTTVGRTKRDFSVTMPETESSPKRPCAQSTSIRTSR